MTKRYNNRRHKLKKGMTRNQKIAVAVTVFIALTMVASIFVGFGSGAHLFGG